ANNTLDSIQWQKLTLKAPEYFLMPQNLDVFAKYDKGFSVVEIFNIQGSGIKFRKDNLLVKYHYSISNVQSMIKDMLFMPSSELMIKYDFSETEDWIINEQRKNFDGSVVDDIKKVMYRPFDERYCYYPIDKIHKIIPRGDSRVKLMSHMAMGDNYSLIIGRQGQVVGNMEWNLIYISNCMMDLNLYYRGGGMSFPLYIYPTAQDLLSTGERQPNFNIDIIKTIAKKLKLTFTPEKETTTGTFAPIDVLDYIYAVLHSPNYRNTYKEFLKTDFPRVPYPKNANSFWSLVNIGSQIRQLHLLQSDSLKQSPVTYPQTGDNKITRKIVQKDWQLLADSSTVGRIYINEQQYFDNIPLIAWEFYIGGYQPAQKWLKDRTGRQLSTADIQHYRKMIKALIETARLMQEVDTLLVL
ncbi:MAG TPA: DNA methyltransferase, partial [Agitococcus sp.]|nr:DNA methyltransferase [Agitococcus sp.]